MFLWVSVPGQMLISCISVISALAALIMTAKLHVKKAMHMNMHSYTCNISALDALTLWNVEHKIYSF